MLKIWSCVLVYEHFYLTHVRAIFPRFLCCIHMGRLSTANWSTYFLMPFFFIIFPFLFCSLFFKIEVPSSYSWHNYSTAIFVINNCLPKVAMRERREQWIVDWFLELCVLSVISDFWSVESIWAWTYDESIPTWRSGALARVMRRTTNGRQSQWVEEHVSKWVWDDVDSKSQYDTKEAQ